MSVIATLPGFAVSSCLSKRSWPLGSAASARREAVPPPVCAAASSPTSSFPGLVEVATDRDVVARIPTKLIAITARAIVPDGGKSALRSPIAESTTAHTAKSPPAM